MASCYTEPLALSACIQDEDEEEKELKSPQRSSSDESEDSEPEPLPASVVRRKVSFADAFGLDLVSVKEFDTRVESAEGGEAEEYHLSHLFSLPASDEELELRLRQHKLELESIELLPGSAIIRGTVRVLNLSYHKVVYVRTTLDGWQSHFDHQAEYIPGSSDGVTDRFSFQLTLMPPFAPDAVRVEFCLCYESSTGIFWANNGGMNYVLFCNKRAGRILKEKEGGKERETEETDQRGKKSCLKPIQKGSCAESKLTDTSSELSEQESPKSVANRKEKTQHNTESQSRDTLEESCNTLAERRNRRRAAQLAYLQEYFSHREPEVPMVVPISQQSIPVMTDTSGTLQACIKKKHNGNTSSVPPDHQIPLISSDWGRNIPTPTPSHPNTSEIIIKTMPVVLEKEQTEDGLTDLSKDIGKAFLNGTDSTDNHNTSLAQKHLLCVSGSTASHPSNKPNIGDKILSVWNTQECAVTSRNGSHQNFTLMEAIESNPAKLSHALDPSQISEVLSYRYPEKTQIISETHSIQVSESIWAQWRPGDAPHDRQSLSDRPMNEHEPILLTNQEETVHADNAIEPLSSKPGAVLLDVCASSTEFLDTEMKVKEDINTVIEDTFTRIRNKPFTCSTDSSERQHINESEEPKKKKEDIRDENKNASQMKMKYGSAYSEEVLVVLESRLQEDDEKVSHPIDGNREIWISSKRSVVCDEGELYKQTEEDKGEEEVERQGEEISFVENIAYRECENGLKAKGQSTYKKQSEGDDDKDKELYKEQHKLQSSTETCPYKHNLCITSQISSPSEYFTWTNIASEGELFPAPQMDFESEETLRYRVAHDLQDPGIGTEFLSPFSKTASPSVGPMSSWLFVCWNKTFSMSCITGVLMWAILCVIFVTAYLHDLPVCLVISLLSACWWYTQGMKKHVTTADSVD